MTLRDIWAIHYESDFAEGMKLLISHDGQKLLTSQARLRMQMLALSGKEIDAYNLGKLSNALHSIKIPEDESAPYQRQAPDPKPRSQPILPHPEQAESASSEVRPSPLCILLHKEHSHWHALMVNATTDEDRAKAAEQVLDVNARLDREYDRLRAIANGEAPAHSMESYNSEATADVYKQKHGLRTRISRLRKLIPSAQGERLEKLKNELAEKQAKLEQL